MGDQSYIPWHPTLWQRCSLGRKYIETKYRYIKRQLSLARCWKKVAFVFSFLRIPFLGPLCDLFEMLKDARTTTVVSSPAISDSQNQSLKSFSHLRGVKNALEGKSGSVLETIDDVKKKIYYYPVEMHPH